ncbi:hypothetical protein chiPu_0019638 [Chiloscyllium punctatum]|uniref:G-protein coupled receptors family 3 profile domain-containing protein n=1 Tax=Chiloscyllium punctatum TaxID=137246 RepID=A0A401RSS7_CHIPU|nr:hypothetical protein [Chiloscyllium punctatum]
MSSPVINDEPVHGSAVLRIDIDLDGPSPFFKVQTTTMCISVSLSGSVVLGCLFAPKVHIILFQPQKNVVTHRVTTSRFSVTGSGTAHSHVSAAHHVPTVCNGREIVDSTTSSL